MNIVVFVTIYICTNNLFLLFDNTTGMTHLKIQLWPLHSPEERKFVFLFCFMVQQPPVGHDFLIHEVSRSYTTMHHSL